MRPIRFSTFSNPSSAPTTEIGVIHRAVPPRSPENQRLVKVSHPLAKMGTMTTSTPHERRFRLLDGGGASQHPGPARTTDSTGHTDGTDGTDDTDDTVIDIGRAAPAPATLRPAEWLTGDEMQLRRRALVAGLAAGCPADRTAVTVILAARRLFDSGPWDEAMVRGLLWVGVVDFCIAIDIDVPERVAESLWAIVHSLHVDAAIDTADYDAMCRPLIDSGGFTPPRSKTRTRRVG